MIKDCICLHCKHVILDDTLILKCTAFPNATINEKDIPPILRAIPAEITSGEFDHRNPYPGDNGIQYEPREK